MNTTISVMLAGALATVTICFGVDSPDILGQSLNDDEHSAELSTARISVLPEGYNHVGSLLQNVVTPTRSYWSLSEEELSRLPSFPKELDVGRLVQGKSGFDIWDAVEKTNAPSHSAIMLSFTIHSNTEKTLTLGLGCTSEAYVKLNGKIIHATRANGFHEFMRFQYLIPLILIEGGNSLDIICNKSTDWEEVPLLHHQNQWLVSLDAFINGSEAWAECRSRNFNLTDTPIVATLDDLRIDATTPQHNFPQLLDLNGVQVNDGAVIDDSGKIKWNKRLDGHPFIGFLRLGASDVDPVIVTASETIDDFCAKLLAKAPSYGETDAWRKRCIHLLNPNFIAVRNYWWARKLAVGMMMCFANQNVRAVSALISECKSADIRFRQYTSQIDGTIQYYRVYIPHVENGASNRPTIVVLPPVENLVSPHLESADVADLHDAEVLASLGEYYKFNIVWPGIVDVDHGGFLARREIQECTDSVATLLHDPTPHFYLIGSCSSGLMALGFAESVNVAGLILQSPIVSRWNSQWIAGLPLDRVDYPINALKPEETFNYIKRLKGTPVYVVFNTDMPGHGDRPGTHDLCNDLKDLGISLEEHWPAPEHYYTWGERARIQLEPMFKWVAETENKQSNVFARPVEKIAPSSIKELLLEGFTVPRSDDAILENWLEHWNDVWARFRGMHFRRDSVSPKGGVIVEASLLKDEDLVAINRGDFFLGAPQMREKNDTIESSDEIWGFRVASEEQSKKILIFRNASARKDLPRIDILLGGSCRGALWKRVDGNWVMINLWL